MTENLEANTFQKRPRWQLITRLPPFFEVKCHICGRWMQSDEHDIYTDLGGPSFNAYYCVDCRDEIERAPLLTRKRR